METLRKLRWVLYPLVFILVLCTSFYWMFPASALKKVVQGNLAGILIQWTPPTRMQPKVEIADVSLWRVSGVAANNVVVDWPPTRIEQQAMRLEIEQIHSRIGIFSWLFGQKNISFDSKLYGGNFSGQVHMAKNGALQNLQLEVDQLNLLKMSFMKDMLGIPLGGILTVNADLDVETNISKDGVGEVSLSLKDGLMGPGSLELPQGGFMAALNIPLIHLGTLTAQFAVDKGQMNSKTFAFTGGDVDGELKISLVLMRKPTLSRLNGNGWFRVKKDFIEKNQTLKTLFEILPELRAAQQGEGKVNFALGGSLGNPRFRLLNNPTMEKPNKGEPGLVE